MAVRRRQRPAARDQRHPAERDTAGCEHFSGFPAPPTCGWLPFMPDDDYPGIGGVYLQYNDGLYSFRSAAKLQQHDFRKTRIERVKKELREVGWDGSSSLEQTTYAEFFGEDERPLLHEKEEGGRFQREDFLQAVRSMIRTSSVAPVKKLLKQIQAEEVERGFGTVEKPPSLASVMNKFWRGEFSLVHYAVAAGNEKLLLDILEELDINVAEDCFTRAARRRWERRKRQLRVPDLDRQYVTPLMLAVMLHKPDMVVILLRHGADVQLKSDACRDHVLRLRYHAQLFPDIREPAAVYGFQSVFWLKSVWYLAAEFPAVMEVLCRASSTSPPILDYCRCKLADFTESASIMRDYVRWDEVCSQDADLMDLLRATPACLSALKIPCRSAEEVYWKEQFCTNLVAYICTVEKLGPSSGVEDDADLDFIFGARDLTTHLSELVLAAMQNGADVFKPIPCDFAYLLVTKKRKTCCDPRVACVDVRLCDKESPLHALPPFDSGYVGRVPAVPMYVARMICSGLDKVASQLYSVYQSAYSFVPSPLPYGGRQDKRFHDGGNCRCTDVELTPEQRAVPLSTVLSPPPEVPTLKALCRPAVLRVCMVYKGGTVSAIKRFRVPESLKRYLKYLPPKWLELADELFPSYT